MATLADALRDFFDISKKMVFAQYAINTRKKWIHCPEKQGEIEPSFAS